MKSRMLRGPAGDVLLAGKIRLCRMCRRHSDVQKEGWYEYGSRMQHICMGYHWCPQNCRVISYYILLDSQNA